MRALLVLLFACAAPPTPHLIGNFDRHVPPPKPGWCDDVLANRLANAGPPIRSVLEARPFDKDAVLAWLREQPCVVRRIVATSSLDGTPDSYDAIAEIPLASGETLRCVASLSQPEQRRPTFALKCARKAKR